MAFIAQITRNSLEIPGSFLIDKSCVKLIKNNAFIEKFTVLAPLINKSK